jgi:hypothetical protein
MDKVQKYASTNPMLHVAFPNRAFTVVVKFTL